MPFHLAGYTESQDSATLVNVAALADDLLTVVGDNIRIPASSPERPAMNFLAAAYALGPNVTQARLVAPSLERLTRFQIAPIDVNAEPTYPLTISELWANPKALDPDENMQAQAAEDGAGATRATLLIWLADGPIQPITGEIFTTRVTGTTTLVANAWTRGTIVLDEELPVGRYALVGAFFVAAGLQAFRFRPIGSPYAPGAVGADAIGDSGHSRFRKGGLGAWFEFTHNVLPSLEYLSNSADTAETGWLDLIKVA